MADAEQTKSNQPGSQQPARKHDEDPVGKVYDSRLMRRLARYVRPYWVQATVSSLAVSLKSVCDVTGPIMVMMAIDRYLAPNLKSRDANSALAHWLATNSPLARVLPSDPYRGISVLAALYLAALLAAYMFAFIQTYLMQWMGQKVMFDLRRDIFRHMQRMHIGFFDVNAVGRLVTRLTSDVDAVNDMFTDGILAIVNDFFMLVIMAAVMLTINWWLALLAFAVLPLILIVTRIFRDHVRESYRRVRAAIARINSFTQEHISGMSVVQLFNREQRAYQDFEAVNRQHMIAFKDTIFAYALYYPAVELLSSVAIALVVWFGGFSVLSHGVVTIGVLAMFIQYSQRFWRPIQDLSDKYNILQAAMAACERIFKLLDTQPEIVSPAHPVEGDGSNRIEFRHVWFTYQKLTEEQQAVVAAVAASDSPAARLAAIDGIEWILKDVCFTVEPGQTVAIVGHTGRGQDHPDQPDDALLRRDGRADSSRRRGPAPAGFERAAPALRGGAAGPVPVHRHPGRQHPLRQRAPSATSELRQAARDVNVLDFIESLPGGFNEPVRERGNSLSTGQKQLINFARALAYNPRILILDEATSSVDTDTELRIRGALERMVEGRTAVLIAHRLSTVQRAETILVMHKGQLREMGSHQELLAQRGLYWKLYQLQYKDQEQTTEIRAQRSGISREPSAISG